MKSSLLLLLALTTSSSAFTIPQPQHAALTQRNMFSGAGEGIPNEDDPEELAKMEQAAKQLGMPLDEYKLGMAARNRMTKEIDDARVTGGDVNTVAVTRDGNNPPQFLEVVITAEGKALGKDVVETKLKEAMKESEEASSKARLEAQKSMMAFVGEEMKKVR